jgi:DNA-binding NarL/FixJ family response regulator
MDKIRVLIADDHQIFRDGIRALLDKEKYIIVVGDVATTGEVMDFLEKNEADVVLMDIDMGKTDGIDATFILKKKYPEVNVLALSMYGEHNYILKMIEAGANGYILKNAGKDELITAINSVAAGGSYFSREVSQRLFENINKLHKTTSGKSEIPLTNREIEILKLIAQEYSNAEIADKLFISIRTVDTHRRNLIEKLGVKNTAGLVKYAFKTGLIE